MDQTTLIRGRFQKSEAEKLITEIMRAKILFHENRINTTDHSEEDIKHSEKRIKELSGSLREMTTLIRNADSSRFDIEAGIKLTVVGDK